MTIPILYGSQTGNARHVAHIIKNALQNGYNVNTFYNFTNKKRQEEMVNFEIIEMDNFNIEKIQETKFIIFICSTHGDGDEPFNMRNFWNFLKLKELPSDFLNNLKFAVYGLGDSSYDKFNYCSKRLFNRLKALGAVNLIERGDGDLQDKQGYNTTLKPWIKELCSKFNIKYDSDLTFHDMTTLTNFYKIKILEKNIICSNKGEQEVLEVNFHTDNYDEFYPGDCIGIYPTNYNYKEFLVFNQLKNIEQCELNLTYNIEDILKTKYDFNFIPNQHIFLHLSEHIKNNTNLCNSKIFTLEQIFEKLNELFTDYDLFYKYILKPKRTFFEVLIEFDIRIDLKFLENHIPRIYPRYFTLTKIDDFYYITISLVKYKTILPNYRYGLCSKYLENIEIGSELNVHIGKSALFFDCKHLLFFCTGTGITLPRCAVNYFTDKEILIYYGHRFVKKDRLHAEEFLGIKNNKIKFLEGISREGKKEYIQKVFKRENPQNIDDFLIFVSGNSILNKEIRKLLKEIYGRNIVFQSETW